MTKTPTKKTISAMRVGLVVPHIFMQQSLLPRVIFSPGVLAQELAEGLQKLGADVTLFSPGPIATSVHNETADLRLFEAELAGRGYGYLDLLKKHPATFISLARQVQSELIARAYAEANAGKLDIIHIYTNEEDIALPFAQFCNVPVIFTHHDPFNFLIRYKSVFPKYPHLNWLSMSYAQRSAMPKDTNWIANIYHGFDDANVVPRVSGGSNYLAYLGRITEPKGVHLAIEAVKRYNRAAIGKKYVLRIAGKHYAGHHKDTYWQTNVLPHIDGKEIIYEGFIRDATKKSEFLAGAEALLVPSVFEEPFGMVMIEALANGTPVIGLDSGAIPEVIKDGETGFIAPKAAATNSIVSAIGHLDTLDRRACRQDFEARFTIEHMCQNHLSAYRTLIK